MAPPDGASRLAPARARRRGDRGQDPARLAQQVLLEAGHPVPLLGETPAGDHPPLEPPDPRALDTIVSAWKIEVRTPAAEAAATVDAFAELVEGAASPELAAAVHYRAVRISACPSGL